MRDWNEYIKEGVDSDLWGFVLLDYFYAAKEGGRKEEPSQFIDRIISELPVDDVDPVVFHNALLCVSVYLLGSSFADICQKSVNFLTRVKGRITDEEMTAILAQYDVFGKSNLLMDELRDKGIIAGMVASSIMRAETQPIMDKTGTVDIGIVIALKEEFREFFTELANCQTDEDEDTGDFYYLFERPCPGRRPYRCVAAFVGDKGEKPALLLTEYMIRKWHPATIVVLGIGASLDKDVMVGDVVVGKQVDSYLDKSKAIAKGKSRGRNPKFEFELGGEVYKGSGELVKYAQNYEFAFRDKFKLWQEECREDFDRAFSEDDRALVVGKGITRESVKLFEGNIASGPAVGAAKAFSSWLKGRDRNYLLLEMESGGVLAAIYGHIDQARSLVLRGISDYGDERKKKMDMFGDGALRRYAMNNAVRFLWRLMEAKPLRQKDTK